MTKIFVMMPFSEEFDDVYHIIKDSGNLVASEFGTEVQMSRADEISEPGRISLQILDAIANADMVVADITGSNPNVMYELGYAHALEKTVVLMNQAVHDSPFDVKDFRQIVYDRSKMLKDCRPRLVAAIRSVISGSSNEADEDSNQQTDNVHQNEQHAEVRRPGIKLVSELQEGHIELQMYNKVRDFSELKKVGVRIRHLIDSVTIVGKVDEGDANNSAAAMGNCAVELEKAEEYNLAEEIFGRAIGLFPDYGGLRLQYSDFLFDLGRTDEAQTELNVGKRLIPNDPRVERLEMKFALDGSDIPDEMGGMLKEVFEADPSNDHKAAAYLIYLTKSDASEETFEAACGLWENSVLSNKKLAPKRALADYLARKNPIRAIEIYENIVRIEEMPEDDRHDALHNLATLYASTDDRDKAIECWKKAYEIDRNDETVKASFSQRLANWGQIENAKKVVKGEPLINKTERKAI